MAEQWRWAVGTLTIKYRDKEVRLPFSEAQKYEARLFDGIQAESVTVTKSGVMVELPPWGILRYKPHDYWSEWWGEDNGEYEGDEAIAVLQKFHFYRLDKLALACLVEIRDDRLTFDELRSQSPELFEHWAIQHVLAEQYKNGVIRQAPKKSRAQYERHANLFGWLEFYQRQGCSIHKAAEAAVENHPHHVPDSWAGDPAQTLARTYKRATKK